MVDDFQNFQHATFSQTIRQYQTWVLRFSGGQIWPWKFRCRRIASAQVASMERQCLGWDERHFSAWNSSREAEKPQLDHETKHGALQCMPVSGPFVDGETWININSVAHEFPLIYIILMNESQPQQKNTQHYFRMLFWKVLTLHFIMLVFFMFNRTIVC